MKRIVALLLAMVMVLGLVACGGGGGNGDTPNQEPTTTPSEPSEPGDTPEDSEGEDEGEAESLGFPVTYDEDVLYEYNFGEFMEYYTAAKEADDLDVRRAMMAVAEAKLLESGLVIPGTSNGGNYAMQRTSTHAVTTVPYGSDSNRMHTYLVVDRDKMILESEIKEINAKWAELRGTGTFRDWVKEYLTGKGYTLQDTYNGNYSSDPSNWDVLTNGQSQNTAVLANTYDGLLIYDEENIQQPGLAESYEVSEDGKVYTFHLRAGVPWVDSQGREIAKVTADDYVAAMQHLLDAKGETTWLVTDTIYNADAYANGEITDFGEVGVKALDELTVEYTLVDDIPYFPTMLSYGTYAPLCRVYYESQGGKFGAEFDRTAADYTYAKGPDSIAYCGPYLITSFTPKNSIVFQANPTYWDQDSIEIKTVTWSFNDGVDVTRNFNDFCNGKIDSCGLGLSTVKLAEEAGLFEDYVRISGTGNMSYYGNFNLARRAYANFNDDTILVSSVSHESADSIDVANGIVTSDIIDDAARTHAAVNNRHFRLAIAFAWDRGAHMAQTIGDDLKYVRLRNTFTQGDLVTMSKDTTIDINGTPTTFPAGTYYGEIIQAQFTADGFPAKAVDTSVGADDPTTGFDGWFNVEEAKKEFALAVEELAAQGVEVSEENPIVLDLVHSAVETSTVNQAQVYVQSMEKAFGKALKINLMGATSYSDMDNATFYPETGAEHNMDITALNFGWGPDWGDPNSNLDIFTPSGAQIIKFGLYG